MDLKEMRNKIYLSIILLTPPTVLLLSWLYFTQIFDPDGSYDGKTRQNGVFFKSYFNFNQFKNSQGNDDILEFEDCLLYTSPSPRDRQKTRMPSSA